MDKLSRQQRIILEMLKRRPSKNHEFSSAYILNYTARISELKAKGYDIRITERKGGTIEYTLLQGDK